MADEVYQLKVNNKEITLGKGSDADDAFISIKEATSMTISAFAYFSIQIEEQDASWGIVHVCIPGFSHWTSAADVEKFLDDHISFHQYNEGWPVLNCSKGNYTWITYEYIGSSAIQGHRWEIAENSQFTLISW